MLTHFIYASSATDVMAPDGLLAILASSRKNNAAVSVTGMLLHVDDSFFQVLEGDGPVLETMMGRISADPRHDQVTRIIHEPIQRRSFPQWSMGFMAPNRDELATLPGLNDFFDGGSSLRDLDQGRAKRLLQAFSQGRWRTARKSVAHGYGVAHAT